MHQPAKQHHHTMTICNDHIAGATLYLEIHSHDNIIRRGRGIAVQPLKYVGQITRVQVPNLFPGRRRAMILSV